MNITETNKARMQALLKVAIEQPVGIESVSLQINDNFNIEPFIPYLLADKWPHAVDPLLIADPNSEEDKVSRAHGILSIVVTEPVTGKFLDFGCGEGHVAVEVANKTSVSVGYDPQHQSNWDRFPATPNLVLTSSWDDVVKNAPYDYVLVYDVFDHLKDENEVVKELKRLSTVVSENTKVYVRMHPWCSRHGTHLYLSVNRAFLHLCLSEESLDKLGYKYLHTIKVIHPLQTYQSWFTAGGFDVVSSSIVPENVEAFFRQPAISAMILKNWKSSPSENLATGKEFPDWQMRQQFVDYILKVKKAT